MIVIRIINYILISIITLSYIYQLIIILCAKQNKNEKCNNHKFAILIAARNEENVIGNLIESIQLQDYPSELIDIFVVADNCSDSTADIARKKGAIVFERYNNKEIGKGYALDFLIKAIKDKYKNNEYDAYIVFDADNLVDKSFIFQMNKTYSLGYDVVSSFRSSKNYGENWITSGSSIWFLHKSLYMKFKMLSNLDCDISGTGFLFSNKVLDFYNGWKFHLLTEDVEFSINNRINNIKSGYSDLAIIYDEQPDKFSDYVSQRMRWTKGNIQVYKKHWKEILRQSSFKHLNLLSNDMSSIILMLSLFNLIGIVIFSFMTLFNNFNLYIYMKSIMELITYSYISMYMMGTLAIIFGWKKINELWYRKIIYTFTFPIIYISYIPIMIIAFFKNVEWKPIKHKG